MKNPELDTAEMFAHYINQDLKIRGMERSLLDSIAAFQIGPIAFTKSGFAQWLNKGDLIRHNKRALVNAIPQSPNAQKALSVFSDTDLDNSIHLVCEHVVPINVITTILKNTKAENGPLDAQKILDIHKSFYRRCIVTKGEDNILNRNKLNRNMPKDWDGKDVYARYKKVGFDWAKDLS